MNITDTQHIADLEERLAAYEIWATATQASGRGLIHMSEIARGRSAARTAELGGADTHAGGIWHEQTACLALAIGRLDSTLKSRPSLGTGSGGSLPGGGEPHSTSEDQT